MNEKSLNHSFFSVSRICICSLTSSLHSLWARVQHVLHSTRIRLEVWEAHKLLLTLEQHHKISKKFFNWIYTYINILMYQLAIKLEPATRRKKTGNKTMIVLKYWIWECDKIQREVKIYMFQIWDFFLKIKNIWSISIHIWASSTGENFRGCFFWIGI